MRHINSEAYHKKTDAFKAGENQAAQLSKPVALPDELKPAWDLWFDTQGVSDDFMQTRNQPIPQVRNNF